jgi:hypothetical protein
MIVGLNGVLAERVYELFQRGDFEGVFRLLTPLFEGDILRKIFIFFIFFNFFLSYLLYFLLFKARSWTLESTF